MAGRRDEAEAEEAEEEEAEEEEEEEKMRNSPLPPRQSRKIRVKKPSTSLLSALGIPRPLVPFNRAKKAREREKEEPEEKEEEEEGQHTHTHTHTHIFFLLLLNKSTDKTGGGKEGNISKRNGRNVEKCKKRSLKDGTFTCAFHCAKNNIDVISYRFSLPPPPPRFLKRKKNPQIPSGTYRE